MISADITVDPHSVKQASDASSYGIQWFKTFSQELYVDVQCSSLMVNAQSSAATLGSHVARTTLGRIRVVLATWLQPLIG